MAFVWGIPDVDRMLDAMSVSQWLEWKAWREIRGPIGPDRWDYYVSYLAMQMGPNPYPRGAGVTLTDFRMPWHPEPLGDDLDDDERRELEGGSS